VSEAPCFKIHSVQASTLMSTSSLPLLSTVSPQTYMRRTRERLPTQGAKCAMPLRS